MSLPIHRGPRRSSDAKIHFLFEVTEKHTVLSLVEDYVDCRMNIKGKSQLSVNDIIELQKKKLDRRRKNSEEDNGVCNDPDFQEDEEEEDDD